MKILETGVRNSRNVQRYIFGNGTLSMLRELLIPRRQSPKSMVIYFVDEYFEKKCEFMELLPVENQDRVFYVSTVAEPTTERVDMYVNDLQIGRAHV